MSKIRAFRALRPVPEKAGEVASPPYDVLSTAEAKAIVDEHPNSFLRVIRAEVEFPADADAYSETVYLRGKENLANFEKDGVMARDENPCFYIYRQQMGDHIQTGIVAGASCVEYENDEIRKHEYTRPTKEMDRARHIETLEAQAGPVWLAYHANEELDKEIERLSSGTPNFNLTAPDGIIHTGWVVDKAEDVAKIEKLFAEKVPLLYIADGHHRSAAACRVASAWREKHNADVDHPSQFFLSVIYPHDQLQILAYNRFVHDLNGMTKDEFFGKLREKFEVSELTLELPSPPALHDFDMYIDGAWYRLTAKEGIFNADDPIEALDVHILQAHVLAPLLGIEDPRTSERIEFIGGIRGHKELVRRVDGEGGLAFACYPTSIEELFAVADASKVMPPKSTWFEPKLRSGLFTYLLKP